MKLKKYLVSILLASLILTSTCVYAEAGHTFGAKVIPEEKTIKPGEEIVITVGAESINMGDNGINAYEGTIEYDKSLFETVKTSNIEELNNWKTTYNDEGDKADGKFLSTHLSMGIKENTSIFNLRLKAKAEIKESVETEVKIKDITSNDGVDLVNIGTKTVKVKINVEKKEEPKTEENPNKELPKTGATIVMPTLAGLTTLAIGTIWIINRK